MKLGVRKIKFLTLNDFLGQTHHSDKLKAADKIHNIKNYGKYIWE